MTKAELPKHPKLDVCRYVFSRPTNGGAFGEYVKEYLSRLEKEGIRNPKRSIISQVELAMKEHDKEEEDRKD